MASVEVNMLPKKSQAFAETEIPLKPANSSFRLPGIKDLLIVAALACYAISLCLLYAKMCYLEKKISPDQITNPAVLKDATYTAEDGISILVDANSTSSGDENSKIRRRRQASGNAGGVQSGTASHAGGYLSNLEVNHHFIHVTGITSENVSRGNWFAWHSAEETAYQNIATSMLPFVHNKFVQILHPGYYYVYSQVIFSDTNEYAIGHEIVKKPNCGNGAGQRLLNSIRSQMPTTYHYGPNDPFYPEDSGYIGGVFYLAANDRVGVRPLNGPYGSSRRFIANQPTGSYFGVFMLSSDPNARVAGRGECHGNINGNN